MCRCMKILGVLFLPKLLKHVVLRASLNEENVIIVWGGVHIFDTLCHYVADTDIWCFRLTSNIHKT